MDQNKVILTAKRMTDARAVLVRDNPFFGRLALGLQLACAPCGTACTDGERLIFDPEFAEQLASEREMQFVILHEVLHCVLEHCTRGGARNSKLFNIACDIVVNSMILGMWGLNTIQVADFEPMHLAPDGKEGRTYNAEEVYQMLLSDAGDDSLQVSSQVLNLPSTVLDEENKNDVQTVDCHDIWGIITEQVQLQDAWSQRMQEAAAACQGTDQIPQAMREIIEKQMQRSKVDWKQMLHDFLQYDTYDYSFLPPDRRFSSGNFFLPTYNIDEETGSANDIWVCIDTSGSISDEQLKEAMLEVRDAMRQANLTGSVSFFDGNLTDPVPFTTESEFRTITPKGGGGTSFHSIFRYLKEKLYLELPRAILIFTDGYVWDWPEESEAMEVPVLWLICKGGNTEVPWGRVAEL